MSAGIQRTFLFVAAVLAGQSPTCSASRPTLDLERADVNMVHGDAEVAYAGSERGSGRGQGTEVLEEYHGSRSHSGSGHSSGHVHHGHVHDEGDLDNALGLVGSACLIPLTVFFALTKGSISAMTLKLLDVFVSIFLAVIWYSAFDQTVATFHLKDRFYKGGDDMFFLIVITTLYLGACRICFMLRDATEGLIIFGGCAGHFIAFAAIGWALNGQSSLAGCPLNPAPRICSFAFCLLPILMSYAAHLITHNVFLEKVGHPELTEVVDEMQIDIVCLVLTFIVTQAVGHTCLGFFPDTEQHESVHQLGHAKNFLLLMLGWMCFLIVFSYVMFPKMHRLLKSHVKVHFAKTSCFMLLAWGYLLVAQVLFHNYAVHRGEMFMQELFSIVTTFLALLALLLIHISEQTTGVCRGNALETRNIGVTAIALTAAWSWEHCFKEAVDIVGERFQVGLGGLVPKCVLAILLPIFILPPYVYYIKVSVIEHDKAAHHDHHGQAAQHGHHSSQKDHAPSSDLVASGPDDAEQSLANTAVIGRGSDDASKEE